MANAIPVPSPQLAGEGFLLRPLGAGDGEVMSQFVEGLRHDRKLHISRLIPTVARSTWASAEIAKTTP